jgi:very-short-patch-repair endonuclease
VVEFGICTPTIFKVMDNLNNNKVLVVRRKYLRNNTTPFERELWKYLKGKNLKYKFRRQHSIGNYILDFYCPEKKLGIELDGWIHDEEEILNKDLKKIEYLKNLGIRIIKFRNVDIMKNLELVLENIVGVLNSNSTTPA